MNYLGNKEECRMPQGTFTIDKVPPKSTYINRNRSDVVISETFESPNEEVMEELYISVEKYFKKIDNNEKGIIEKLFQIVTELDARECSSNTVISEFQNIGWKDLCDIGIDLLNQLKL